MTQMNMFPIKCECAHFAPSIRKKIAEKPVKKEKNRVHWIRAAYAPQKFIVTRTSQMCDDDKAPCPDAEPVKVVYRDIRNFNDKEEWLAKWPKDNDDAQEWGKDPDGRPFRIRKDAARSIWVVVIKDLTKFVKEHGNCIISGPTYEYVGFEDVMNIEIYDDYRE